MPGYGIMYQTTVLLAHFVLPGVTSLGDDDPIVGTQYGYVIGTRTNEIYELSHSKVTSAVNRFLGVPYAKAPTGSRRFRPPERPDPINDFHAIDARDHGKVCPQISFHRGTAYEFQNEDCLTLDLYVPYQKNYESLCSAPFVTFEQNDDVNASYPVMLFIHGGSFEVGSGKLYDGTVLAQLGAIVVTINYRLGALGFMSAGAEELGGNLGLMDQVMSLTWVHENIDRFGGDPNRVTVFGHSAGGASVGLLMVVPQAEGLFSGIIAQSGSAVASYSVHDDDIDFRAYVKQVGVLFDCRQPSVSDLLDCLRGVQAESFIKKRLSFPRYDPIDPEFRPCVDGTWVPDTPQKLFQAGRFHKVPIMTGTVRDEFANYFNGGARYRPAFDHALDRYAQSYVKRDDVMNLVKYEYTDWTGTSTEEYDRGAVLSDMHMVAPTVQLAEEICRHSPTVYQYHFAVEDCYHSLELNYVFGAPFSGRMADEMSEADNTNFTRRDKLFSLQMMRLWTNFAKQGNPTPPNSPEFPAWQPFDASGKAYIELGPDELSVRHRLREDKVSFWNDVIPGLRRERCLASGEPRASHQAPCPPAGQRIHLWVFLLSLTVLFLVLMLLLTLFIRNLRELQKHKHSLYVGVRV